MRTLALLLSLMFLAAPAVAEDLRITAAAATADQFSTTITRPPTAEGAIIIVDVTIGVALLLDVNMDFYDYTLGAWRSWFINCPTAGFITGVGTFACVAHPRGEITHYSANVGPQFVVVPSEFRIWVNHGNATAATYTVRTQWIRRK